MSSLATLFLIKTGGLVQLYIQYFLGAVLLFSTLVFHEMGHWVVLRRLNVNVESFQLGMGPSLFKIGRFQLNCLPIGAGVLPNQVAYQALSASQRLMAAAGGPIASFVYALVLLVHWPWFEFNPGILKIALFSAYLGALNLVPLPPLDGYKILEAYWDMRGGCPLSERTKSVCYKLSNGMLYAVGFFVLTKVLFPH